MPSNEKLKKGAKDAYERREQRLLRFLAQDNEKLEGMLTVKDCRET